MGLLGFWIITVIAVLTATVTVWIRQISFADIMAAIMVALLTLSFDMIFCKQLFTYYYVDKKFMGINSLIVGLLVFPSIAVVFNSFSPKGVGQVVIYIGIWTTTLTLLELYIAKPLGIVVYDEWKVIPWSPVVYILSFTWLFVYTKTIESYVK